jgi:hypothetical protein
MLLYKEYFMLSLLFRSLKKIISFTTRMVLISSISFVFLIGILFTHNHLFLKRYSNDPFDTTQFRSRSTSLIHELLAKTEWKHLEPCGAHFNERKNFEESLSCTNKALKETGVEEVSRNVSIPTCYVITSRSPDVVRAGLVNLAIFSWATPTGRIAIGAVLGFFIPDSEHIFVVENIDVEEIYRHELQHYFLKIAGVEQTDKPETIHSHHTYDVCEARTYTKSSKVKELEEILNVKTHKK